MNHHLSAQQKCTIPTLEPPALLVTCQQPGVSLVSVTEWSVGVYLIPSKYTSYSRKWNLIHTLINILVTDPV